MANTIGLQFEVDTKQIKNADKEIDNFTDSVEDADKAVDDFGTAIDRTGKQTKKATNNVKQANTEVKKSTKFFKLQKGASQQAGYQLQDFAVQVQGGTSALTAFGQQGSQLAGILGPGGALLGAVIAIGSAVGGVLYKALTSATEETDRFTRSLDDLRDQAGRT